MAEVSGCADLYSGLLNQNGEIDCSSCSELMCVLKNASDEISSLKLIIQMLINDCKTEGDIPDTDSNLSSLGDLVNIEKNSVLASNDAWSTVSSKFGASNRNNRKPYTNKQADVTTSNKYSTLANIQESPRHLSSNKVVLKSQELRDQSSNISYIPYIISGEIYSSRTNNLVNSKDTLSDVSSRYNKQSDVEVYNKLSPVKPKCKMVILSDSHLKGCLKIIKNLLGDSVSIMGWTKPGALAKELLDGPNIDLVKLDKKDVIVISAGANDIYRNNASVALRKTVQFMQRNYNTNIIVYGVPQRYDLLPTSCVNVAIHAFNTRLKKLASSFRHVSILDSPSDINSFTSFGMHLNGKGKRGISKQLSAIVTKLTVNVAIMPIVLDWYVNHESDKSEDDILEGNDQIVTETVIKEVNEVHVNQTTIDQY